MTESPAHEFMTTGAAGKLIEQITGWPISLQTVRRLIDAGELIATWTRPPSFRMTDKNGHVLRGWRRVSRASVEAYAERIKNGQDSAAATAAAESAE